MAVRKGTIAVSIDLDLIAEMRRISAATDAPLSRIANRALTAYLKQEIGARI